MLKAFAGEYAKRRLSNEENTNLADNTGMRRGSRNYTNQLEWTNQRGNGDYRAQRRREGSTRAGWRNT